MSNNLKLSDITKTTAFFTALIALFFIFSKFFASTFLPISESILCVYPLVNTNGTQIGVASYRTGDIWITAQHVLEDCDGQCNVQIKNYNNQKKDLSLVTHSQQNLGNDRGVFQIVAEASFTTANCATDIDGLVTFVSGSQQKIPATEVTGIFISYMPDFGQSGSPFFEEGRIIGVMSRKWVSGGILNLIDE